MGCSPPVCTDLLVKQLTLTDGLLSYVEGPISESDFFLWEALICGPKDTPFVSCPNSEVEDVPTGFTTYRKVASLQPS